MAHILLRGQRRRVGKRNLAGPQVHYIPHLKKFGNWLKLKFRH